MALKANKIFLIIIKLAISSALLYIVLSKTSLEKVLDTLKNMSLTAFIAAIFIYTFTQLVGTLRWKLLLPAGIRVKKLFSLYMIGAFFNNFLPGIIGGDAVKGYYLYKATGKGGLIMASIFMDRYIGFLGLITISIAAFPFGFNYMKGSRAEWLLPLVVLSFFTVSFLIFGLRIGEKIRLLSEFYTYFHAYRNQKEVVGKAFILSVLIQFSGIIVVYLLSLGMGQRIPLLAFLIFLPLIILFTTIPISISGLGIREGAFVLFFGFIGIKPEIATAISLSWFTAISISSLIGLIEYIKYKKEKITLEV